MTPSFAFHVSAPNNEDVYPLVLSDWLAVADGMGGSGCMKHAVPEEKRATLSAVLEYVLPEALPVLHDPRYGLLRHIVEGDGSGAPSYLSYIFAPCIRDEVNTSARWASRIVMARFAFFVLSRRAEAGDMPWTRADYDALGAFIEQGLKNTVAALSLTVSNPDMTLLPSTFAALHVVSEGEKECVVRAVWAGDSRCYLLDAGGLKKLSADDENESGLLTNNLSAEGSAGIRVREYRLPKPFVLFCASDGFFDAYGKSTELPVEAELLEDIFAAESWDRLKSRLSERYLGNLSDDTSVALGAFGLQEYAQLKEMLAARREQTASLYSRYRDYASIFSLIQKPEHQVTASICDRFESKFPDIVRALADAYFDKRDDFLLTQRWREDISACVEECRKQLSSGAKTRKEALKERVLACLHEEGCRANLLETLPAGGLGQLVGSLCEREEKCERLRRERAAGEDAGRLDAEAERLCAQLEQEQARILVLLSAASGDAFTPASAHERSRARCRLIKELKTLAALERDLTDEKPHLGDEARQAEREYGYSDLVARALKYCRERGAYRGMLHDKEEALRAAEREYESAFKKFRGNITCFLDRRREVFTAAFIEKLDMERVLCGDVDEDELHRFVSDTLAARFGKDAGVMNATLEVFRREPAATSCIDRIFPASRLADFRRYYLHRGDADLPAFAEYRQEMEAYDREGDALLAAPAGLPAPAPSAPAQQTAEAPQAEQQPQAEEVTQQTEQPPQTEQPQQEQTKQSPEGSGGQSTFSKEEKPC